MLRMHTTNWNHPWLLQISPLLNLKALLENPTWVLLKTPKPNKLLKNIRAVWVMRTLVLRLAYVNSRPPRLSLLTEPPQWKKEKMIKKGVLEPMVKEGKGKNIVGKFFKGDTVVGSMVMTGGETTIRRSRRLAKNNRKKQIIEDSEEKQIDNKDDKEEETEEEEEENVEGPHSTPDNSKIPKETSASHSSYPLAVEPSEVLRTADYGEELRALKKKMDTLDKRFKGLTRFTMKLGYFVTSTLSMVIKEELEGNNAQENQGWVGDDAVDLLFKNWDNASCLCRVQHSVNAAYFFKSKLESQIKSIKKPIPVVLDDFWQLSDLQGLLFKGEQYITVVTTRDKKTINSILQLFKKGHYHLKFLEEEHALSLFCHCAFDMSTIPDTHNEELIKKVQAECKGLPLALQVMGSSLNDEPDCVWEATRDALAIGEAADDNQINFLLRRLKTSIDVLNL